jgi:hypothetical protein
MNPGGKERFWKLGNVRWDPTCIGLARDYCSQAKVSMQDGLPLLIHTLVISLMDNLSLKRGSVQSIMITYNQDWENVYTSYKEINNFSKKIFSDPDTYFQSLILKRLGGSKK